MNQMNATPTTPQPPAPQAAPEITQFAPSAGGTRACQFDADGFRVLVTPNAPESNDDARRLASQLCDAAAAIQALELRATTRLEEARSLRGERDGALRELREAREARTRGPARIMSRGYVRFDPKDGRPWLLSKRETGWAAFGVFFDDWDDLFRSYNVRVVEQGCDVFGCWWAVENFSK